MADASISLSQAHGLFELEGPKPLRESALWQLQSAFYREKAEAAWRDAIVPNFVTSNSFVASCYARIILAHIRDYFLRYVGVAWRAAGTVHGRALYAIGDYSTPLD